MDKLAIKSNQSYLTHPGMIRFIASLAKRLPPADLETLKRTIIQLQFSPKIDAPLFDFMTFLNIEMPDDQWESVVDGAAANFAAIMADRSKRLSANAVKVAPSLGSPIAAVPTISQGDIDALSSVKDRDLQSSIETLKGNRQQIRRALRNKDLTLVNNLGFAMVAAVKKSSDTGIPFMQALADVASRLNGKPSVSLRNKQLFEPLTNTKLVINDDDDDAQVGEGALSPATITAVIKAGRFIIDAIQVIYLISSSLKIKDATSSIESANPDIKLKGDVDKFLANLQNIADKYGSREDSAKLKTELSSFKLLSPPNNRISMKPGFSDWYQVILTAWVQHFTASVYHYLQKKLADVFKKKNPKEVKIYNWMTPPPSMPVSSLFTSLFDPDLLKNSKVMSEEWNEYNKALQKYDPSTVLKSTDFTGMMTGTHASEVSAFKPLGTLTQIFDQSDGWQAIVDEYVKTVLVPYLPKLVKAFHEIATKTFAYVSKILTNYPDVSTSLAFGTAVPVVYPWKPTEMDALMLRLKTLQDGQRPITQNQNTSGGDNKIEDVNFEDVKLNEVKASGNDDNGTILVTPNETIINLGHYVDPTTNKLSDYMDLYVLGKSIRDAKDRARLMISMPYQAKFLSGDIAEGGILDIALKVAGKVGKKVLNSKLGQKILKKLPSKITDNMIAAVGANNPKAVAQLASATTDAESAALNVIQKQNGSLPSSPSAVVDVVNAIQTIAPVIVGMDAKLDRIIETLNKFSFHTLTTKGAIEAGMNGLPLADAAQLNAAPRISLTDALALSTNPEVGEIIMSDEFNEPSSEGDTLLVGDVDLWRVV